MQKPIGFDEVQEFTEFKKLPKGGYICRIMKVEETKSQNGNDMVLVYLDIADGEYAGYFSSSYSNDTRPNKKWGAVIRQVVLDSTTGQTSRGFKGFITAMEKSNAGWVNSQIWNDNFCQFFKGKVIGCVFGDSYYINAAGKKAVFAKPQRLYSVETIKKNEFKIPDDEYSDNYPKEGNAVANNPMADMGFVPMTDAMGKLPF